MEEIRQCKYCGRELPLAEYFELHKITNDKTYRRHKCKDCYRLMKKDRRKRIHDWFESFKKDQKCSRCGNCDYRVLEFHHVNGDKEENVSVLVSRAPWSLERIKAEIEKCEVLCANCHRIIHYDDWKGATQLVG